MNAKITFLPGILLTMLVLTGVMLSGAEQKKAPEPEKPVITQAQIDACRKVPADGKAPSPIDLTPDVKTPDTQGNAAKEKIVWSVKKWDMQYYDGQPREGRKTMDPGPEKNQGPDVLEPIEKVDYWGWFNFGSGLWWAQTIHQPEALWNMYQPQKSGWKEPKNQYSSVWMRQFQKVNKNWRDKAVIFHLANLKECDVIVYVNRKRAGVIYHPEGNIDISPYLKLNDGDENEMLMLVTSNGLGLPVSRGKKGYPYDAKARRNYRPHHNQPIYKLSPNNTFMDVFANTSWRNETLTVETEIQAKEDVNDALLLVEVKDMQGNLAKRYAQKVDLKAGLNKFAPVLSWNDPICWEFGVGYMYTMNVTLFAGKDVSACKPFRFGFRELWRDGKEIMMNGHKQRFRTVYNFNASGHGFDLLKSVGYNVVHFSHVLVKDPQFDEKRLYEMAERGMGCVLPTTIIMFNEQGNIAGNKTAQGEYEELAKRNIRRYRNIPSVILYYFGVNNIVPQWSMDARYIGNGGSDGWRSDLVNRTVKTLKQFNPNVLFFSHADGNCGDVASHNLYLNFTPMQEREEWFSHWSFAGKNPWQGAEFGNPYFQCWYKQGVCFITEYLAMFSGEEAYLKEPESITLRLRPGLYIRRVQHPMYWQYTHDLVWRTNRSWRTYGQNGGLVWFNLEEGFGMPDWHYLDKLWNQYGVNYDRGKLKTKVPEYSVTTSANIDYCGKNFQWPDGKKVNWLWPSYYIYQLGNKDFLGYIGGYPSHTDKTHAYYAGEKIQKQAIFLWDNIQPAGFTAKWNAKMSDGRELGSGTFHHDMKIAETKLDKIEFTAPDVKKKTQGTIHIVYTDDKNRKIFEDSLDFHVYPVLKCDWSKAPPAALIDKSGLTEQVLRSVGYTKYRKVDSIAKATFSTYIIIGKDEWKDASKDVTVKMMEQGKHILVMPQLPETWNASGFRIEETMSRNLFLRDTVSGAFDGITNDELREWRGVPYYSKYGIYDNQPWGTIVRPRSKRGPRWTHNFALSAMTIQTPDAVGFQPLIVGEFDMGYSALFRFLAKKGSITYCALDFEKRTENCPLAAKTAAAVLKDFLCTKKGDHSRRIYYMGAMAGNLVKNTFPSECEEAKTIRANGLTVIGPDAKVHWKDVKRAAGNGAGILVFCDTAMAMEAGLKPVPAVQIYHVKVDPREPLLKGLGAAEFHWRDFVDYDALQPGKNKDFHVCADGLFAYATYGKGMVVFGQLDPRQMAARLSLQDDPLCAVQPVVRCKDTTNGSENLHNPKVNAKQKADWSRGFTKNVRPSFRHLYQIYARILTNMGADPGEGTIQKMLMNGDKKVILYNPDVPDYDPYLFTYW